MALAGQVGVMAGVDFGYRFRMEKGMFQCILLEYPLINYSNSP